MIELNNLSDLVPVSNQLLALASDKSVWCFRGEMGAGKTTLIKAICDQLGVQDAMSSPTFSIVNEYSDKENESVYHFDFYRIKDEDEAREIGAEEYFYSGNYCFIEWPEKVAGLLPDDRVEIIINLVDSDRREIKLIEHGKEGN
ncbi:MAG: tRNA (adenosine(37)-N6)-threonylcarbamoyltransferase complex ATPase subunit type 1 TsaE [Cyclobacteriaceae bacterium]